MKKKRLLAAALTLVLTLSAGVFTGPVPEASAKTQESSAAENVFFYSKDDQGNSVLLKVMSLDELKALSHGQSGTGTSGQEENYYISTTDNYPTTQYCEARGFTIPELVEYVKETSSVDGAGSISYSGDDVMSFMATDSYGNYMHSWTYDELYGEPRYYFEGLYDASSGWNSGWEIAGEENSKYGMDLATYNAQYRDQDPYYEAKRSVFEGGEETEVILATESYSGRTTSSSLVASTEIGISDYISANGGTVAGSLSDVLEDTWALRLCIPMTEADLMTAHRTAYDNFKWIYNVQLDMQASGAPASQGTVAAPEASVSLSADGSTLSISMSCDTPGAQIYYSFDGAPQTLYNGTVTYDVSGRNLESDPVTFYMTAVKEGYDDAGIITVRYPQSGVTFKTQYSAMTGSDLVFEAEDSVTQADWNEWTQAILGISVKTPSATGYAPLDTSDYTIDNSAKTITIDQSVFTETGSYGFSFYARNFANKNVSLTVKRGAPQISAGNAALGGEITFTFDDSGYQNGLYMYVTAPGKSDPVMISSNYLDRTVPGQVKILTSYYDSPSCEIQSEGTYVFELVNNSYEPSSQSVSVQIGGASALRFSDVSADSWYYDAVNYVAENGYFSGTSASTFSPSDNMTRGMFVTVLGRLAGIDASQYSAGSFSDVAAEKYYAPYVEWASENGIVTGVGGGRFDPDGLITREQMAAIMYNYVAFSGGDVTADRSRFDSFSDKTSVSAWAEEAMIWACSEELINGSGGALTPKGSATRAQVAQIIMNFCETIGA